MADAYSVVVNIRGQNNLSQPVNQATQSLQRLNTEARNASNGLSLMQRSFTGIQTAMAGAFAGVGLMAVKGFAEDLYQTGMEAQRAEMLFKSFGAQIGDTSALLDRLRAASRGVVTDVDLMSAASSQLSMGLAKNANDVERLSTIAITFAQAMGQDVGSSLDNLNMLLANRSFERLDSLGISSTEVRQLEAQYRAAGMDSSEAFTAAFLQVAEQKLPQMAAVADATVTEIQKMQASLDNWWADFGNRFAQGVNGLVGIITYLDDIVGKLLRDVGTMMLPGAPLDVPLVENGPSVPAVNAAMYAQFLRMQASAGNYAQIAPYQMAAYDFTGYVSPAQMAIQQAESERAAQLAAARQGYMSEVYARSEDLQRLSYGRASGLFSQAEVEQARAWLWTLEQGVDTLQNMGADEAAMRPMLMLRDAAVEWKDNIEAGAARLENLSLSGLFGQTSGGRLGEIDTALASYLSGSGMSQDMIDAYMTAAGLDSGSITSLSQQFDTEVLPMLAGIYEQFGEDAAITARTSYEQALQDAALAGQTGPLNLSAALGYTPYGTGTGGGRQFQVNYGDDWNTLINRTGLSQDQIMQAAGITNARLLMPGTYTYGGGGMIPTDFLNMDGLETAMMGAEVSMASIAEDAAGLVDDMTTATDTLATGVDKVFGKRYTLEVDLSILGKDAFSRLLAEAVQANGGTVPGASPYGGKSGGSMGTGKTGKG